MKKPLFLLLLAISVGHLLAKEAYNIKIKITGLPNTNVQLAYYLGDKQYIKQEKATNAGGEVVFNGDTALPAGVYLAVFGQNNNYFEFLVEEQFFNIETEYSGDKIITESLKAAKSAQNTQFFQYTVFLSHKKEEAEAIKALQEVYKKNPAKKDDVAEQDKKLEAIDAEVKAYQDKIIADYKGKLIAKLLRAYRRPTIPEQITDNNERFYYYRAHFWDDFDFTCAGLLYSSSYHQRIKEFINNLTVQHYDSVFRAVDDIIQRSKANPEIFKYTVVWALNEYAKSKTVCFDAVYVGIAQKYYVTGQANWVDKEQLDKIIANAASLANIRCGQKAPDIVAKTESYATPSLYKTNAKQVVLFFWDADCAHCKKDAKELKDIYETYKHKGVMIYSVEIGDDVAKWQKFTAEEGIGWINLQQSAVSTEIKNVYDVKATPQLFLLNENKEIEYKRIDPAQLNTLLADLLK